MIEKIEPYKTGLIVMGIEDLIRSIILKLNESIEKQNEIIDLLNSKEEKEEKEEKSLKSSNDNISLEEW